MVHGGHQCEPGPSADSISCPGCKVGQVYSNIRRAELLILGTSYLQCRHLVNTRRPQRVYQGVFRTSLSASETLSHGSSRGSCETTLSCENEVRNGQYL